MKKTGAGCKKVGRFGKGDTVARINIFVHDALGSSPNHLEMLGLKGGRKAIKRD